MLIDDSANIEVEKDTTSIVSLAYYCLTTYNVTVFKMSNCTGRSHKVQKTPIECII